MHKCAFSEQDICSRLSANTTRRRLEALLHEARELAAGKREGAE